MGARRLYTLNETCVEVLDRFSLDEALTLAANGHDWLTIERLTAWIDRGGSGLTRSQIMEWALAAPAGLCEDLWRSRWIDDAGLTIEDLKAERERTPDVLVISNIREAITRAISEASSGQ